MMDAKHDRLTEGDYDQIRHAMRVLRFLGSEAATRELARRFWFHDQPPGPALTPGVGYPVSEFYQSQLDRGCWDFKAGLIGSPFRAVAIREMNAAIDDRRHRATRAMVETLAPLEIQSKPEYKLPAHDSASKEEREKERQAKAAAYNQTVDALWEWVSSAQ